MRKTKQRQVIIEELMKLRTHPSAGELYGRVKRRLPRISLGTVYRNLDILRREGMIGMIDAPGSPKRFDGDIEAHQHIRCVRCGRIDDLPAVSEPTARDLEIARGTGYRLLGRRVEFVGVCRACRKRGREH
jgi:Fur family ferric uptake transcriptional regulator